MAFVTAPDFPIKSIDWSVDSPSQSNVSAWTGTRTNVVAPWFTKHYATVTLATQQSDDTFRTIRSFLYRTRGSINIFRLYATAGPQNSNSGVTLSADAAAMANSISITGATTPLFDGQYFTLNGQLCCCTADQSGSLVTFEPPLRKAASSGTIVVTSRPYALVFLSQSKRAWNVATWRQFGISFDVEEALGETDATAPEAGSATPPPVLSSPTATADGSSGATLGVSTDTGNGTWFWSIDESATTPTAAQIMAGEDHTGSAAVAHGSQAVSAPGEQSATASGLDGSTTYYAHYVQENDVLGISVAITSGAFTTSAAAPSLSPYTGQVATRAAVPSTKLSQTKAMSRVAMYAAEALSSFQLKFGAWYVDSTSGSELTTGIGSAVTYTASIEYPAGTFTQIKWGGSASGVAAIGGDTGLCDAIALAIPQGAKFFVRVYATTTAAGIPVSDQNPWNAGGDASVVDGTATDQTMSGTVTGANTQGIFPLCVVQTTTNPTFMFVGDSRTGSLVAQQDSNGNLGQFAYGLGTSYGYINVARGSAWAAHMVDAGTRRAALSQYVSHVVNGFGINDIGFATATLLQLQTYFLTMAYMMPGKRHVLATLSPYTTSSDSFATLANQTVNSNDAVRIAFNTWARSLPDPYFACIDIASVTESGGASSPSGKWVVGDTSDGLHQNATGAAAILSAGVFNPATIGANAGLLRFSPLEYSPNDWYDAADYYHNNQVALRPRTGGTIFTGTAAFGATSFNGGPGYAFTTSGQYWYQSADPVSQNASGIMLGMLWTPSAYPAATTGIGGYTVTNNSTARAMIMMDASGHPGLAVRRLDADTTVTAYGSTPLAIGSPYLLVLQCDVANGVAYLYVNGVLTCQANYASSGSTSSTATFQTLVSFFGSKGAYGTLGEFTGFNIASATDAVRQKLEGDMAWRRAAAATFLPSGHPYLSVRPPN